MINKDEMIKPILMNTEMVRAALDGRKTVTRRVVKLHANDETFVGIKYPDRPYAVFSKGKSSCYELVEFPYRPGDILYVRETWNYGYCDTTDFECQCNETFFEELKPGSMKDSFLFPRYFYRTEDLDGIVGMKWRPSIHMPREAARIFLRVTDVRVERLQEMKVADIKKEGFVPFCFMCRQCKDGRCRGVETKAIDCWLDVSNSNREGSFRLTWNSTIKHEDRAIYGWEANPWVWVVEFERISREEAGNA